MWGSRHCALRSMSIIAQRCRRQKDYQPKRSRTTNVTQTPAAPRGGAAHLLGKRAASLATKQRQPWRDRFASRVGASGLPVCCVPRLIDAEAGSRRDRVRSASGGQLTAMPITINMANAPTRTIHGFFLISSTAPPLRSSERDTLGRSRDLRQANLFSHNHKDRLYYRLRERICDGTEV